MESAIRERSPEIERPCTSSVLTSMDIRPAQASLKLVRRAAPNDEPIEKVRRCKSKGHAFSLACNSSLLEDKEIADGIDVDAAYLSRMKQGKASLDADKLAEFCYVVNNRIYAEWLAYQTGCTLVQIESETERQLRIAREEVERLRMEKRVLVDALNGRSA